MGPGLRLQPKASQKKVQAKSLVAWKWWTHPETLALIDIWGDAMADYCKTYKGKRILPSSAYEKIAKKLKENGIKRSVEQIREKIKTLKKSFWGVLAKTSGGSSSTALRMNGKRQSVIEKMQRVLQDNGHIVKGKYMWKTDTEISIGTTTKAKAQRKSKRGRKTVSVVEEESKSQEDEDEIEGQIEVVSPVEEAEEDEMLMGIRVDPDHIHGSSEHWAEMSGEHQLNMGDGTNTSPQINYDYSLCQLMEGVMNKFISAQRESEDRFLLQEEQRMKAETKRWETLQKRDDEMVTKMLQTYDKWRKEDREHEMRLWAALTSKLDGNKSNSKTETPFTVTSPSQLQLWQFTGTFRPSSDASQSTTDI